MNETSALLHATTVAIAGRGVLIIGPSGAGKSALALQLMALGAELVADDRTLVNSVANQIVATVPQTITGKIEARGVGILNVAAAGPTPVGLVIDLAQRETQRLPQPHTHEVLGVTLPCLHNAVGVHFPSAILLYMMP